MPTIWTFVEVSQGRITSLSLEMLTKAAELGQAEAILLGPAPDDAVATLGAYGAKKVYRSPDPLFAEYLVLPAARVRG